MENNDSWDYIRLLSRVGQPKFLLQEVCLATVPQNRREELTCHYHTRAKYFRLIASTVRIDSAFVRVKTLRDQKVQESLRNLKKPHIF